MSACQIVESWQARLSRPPNWNPPGAKDHDRQPYFDSDLEFPLAQAAIPSRRHSRDGLPHSVSCQT